MLQYLNRLDHQLFEFIQLNFRSGFADPIFLAFRDKYCWIPLYIFLISWLIFTYTKAAWKIFAVAIVCIIITDQLNSTLIKGLVKRDRPCKEMYFKDQFIPVIDCSGGYSFPSSHATNHMGIASLLFFACRRELKKWRWLLIAWAILIGWSQVYIGVHFPLDVLAGWLEGFGIGYFLSLFMKHYLNWNSTASPKGLNNNSPENIGMKPMVNMNTKSQS